MSTQTLIVSPILYSWAGDLTDWEKSHEIPAAVAYTDVHDCLSVRTNMLTSLAGVSIDVMPYDQNFGNGPSAEKMFMMFKVVGEVQIITTGKDYNNSTAITGKTVVYGTSLLPGMAMISTYNLVSATVLGVAATSSVRYISCVITYPTDTRIEA